MLLYWYQALLPFPPMSVTSQSEIAYTHLRRQLSNGELRPGDRLVNRALADELGMSFIPVREAISRLASEGLVDRIAGAGAFVHEVDRRELSELYDVRLLFEPFAAAEAARHVTAHELREMEAILAEWETTGQAVLARKRGPGPKLLNAWADANERFHERLVEASRNRWLAKLMRELRVVSLCFAAHRQAPGLLTKPIIEAALSSHRELLNCLHAGDTGRAETLVRKLLERGREEVLGYFDQEKS